MAATTATTPAETEATKKTTTKKAATTAGTARAVAVAEVLKALHKNKAGRMSRTELKAATSLAPTYNWTGLVRHLEDAGLAKEVKKEGDKYRMVELTAKGRKALEAGKVNSPRGTKKGGA